MARAAHPFHFETLTAMRASLRFFAHVQNDKTKKLEREI